MIDVINVNNEDNMNKKLKKLIPLLILLMVLVSVVLVACNVEKVTVTYLSDDGATQYGTQEVEKNTEFTANQTPTKEGYIFKGWATTPTKDKSESEYTVFEFPAKISSNISLYAIWQVAPAETFTVTFKVGDTVVKTQTVEKGGSATLPEEGEFEIPAGKIFVSWDGDITNITADTTINAVLEDAEYTVTFHDIFAAKDTVIGGKYGDVLPNVPGTPVRTGYSFDGWFYSADGGVNFGEKYTGGTFTQSSDVYARYSIQSLADYQGEFSISADKTSYTYGDTVTLTANSPAYAHIVYSYEWSASNVADLTKISFNPNAGNIEYTLKITAKSDLDSPTISVKEDTVGVNLKWSTAVNKAILTVTADAKTAVFGDPVPELSYTYSGFKFNDTADVITLGNITTAYAQYSDAKDYAITLSGFEADNYDIKHVDSTLKVSPYALDVAINGNKTFDNTGYRANAADLNKIAGLPAWLKFTDESYYFLKSVNAKTYSISEILTPESETKFAFLANGENTNAANIKLSYNINITIDRADITKDNVIISEYNGIYDGNAHKIEVEFKNLLGEKNSTIAGINEYVNAGNYTDTISVTYSDNYNEYSFEANVNITAKDVSVNVSSKSVTYGETLNIDKTTDITVNDFVNDTDKQEFFDNIGISTTYIQGDSVALSDRVINVELNKYDNANYTIKINKGSVTIEKRVAKITPEAISVEYGEADSLISYKVDNTYAEDKLVFTGALTREQGTVVGDYLISQGTLALTDAEINANYDIEFVSGVVYTITARNITVGFNQDSYDVIYGESFSVNALAELKDGTTLAYDDMLSSLVEVTTDYVAFDSVGTKTLTLSKKGNNANYNITILKDTVNLNVIARDINVNVSGEKIYDGNIWSATFDNSAVTNLLNGHVFSVSVESVLAGIYGENVTYALASDFNISNVTVMNGEKDVTTNYNFIYEYNVTINYVAPNVDTNTTALTYNGLEQNLGGVTTNGGEVSYSLDENGTYTSTLPTAKNADNYAVYYKVAGTQSTSPFNSSYTIVINQAALSVTADNQTVTYGDNANDFSVSYNGFVGNDNASVLGGALVFESNYTQGNSVETYDITPSGLTSDNYNITFVNGNITVERREVTVTPKSNQSKVYGDDDPSLTYEDIKNIYNNDNLILEGTLSRVEGEIVGTYAINQGSLKLADNELNNNYTLVFSSQSVTFEITAREISVGIKDGVYSVTYGNDFSTSSLAELKNNTTLAKNDSLDELVTVKTDYDKASISMANCKIWIETKADSNTLSNYTVNVINDINNAVTLTITQRDITLSVTGQQKTYDGDVWTYTLNENTIVSGLVNGDIFGGTISTIEVGLDKGSITYNQPADFDTTNVKIFNNGVDVSKNYNITYDLEVTITYSEIKFDTNNETKQYDATAHAPNLRVTDDSQNVEITYSLDENGTYTTEPISFTDAGTYTVYYKITATDKSPVSGHFSYTITPAALSVSANDQSVVYGEDFDISALTNSDATISGLLGNDTLGNISFTTSYVKGNNVGTYSITPVPFTLKNYNVSVNAGTLNVTKRTVTLTPNSNQSKVYGNNDIALTFSVDNIYNNDFDNITGFSGALNRVSGENVGDYAIDLGTLALKSEFNRNYELKFSETVVNFTISPLAISISIDDKGYNVNYGNAFDTNTVTVLGSVELPFGEKLDSLVSVKTDYAQFSNYTENGYKLYLEGIANSNYTVTILHDTNNAIKLSVNKLNISVSKTDESIYDGVNAYSGTLATNNVAGLIDGQKFTADFATKNFGEYGKDIVYKNASDFNITNVKITDADGNDVSINYNVTYNGLNVTIKYVAPNVETNTNALTYNGLEQNLGGVTTNGGKVSYSLTQEGEYTTAIPTAKNANSYTVYYKVASTQTTSPFNSSYVIVINTAQISITIAPDALTKVYDGADTHTVTYTVNGEQNGEKVVFDKTAFTISGRNVNTYNFNAKDIKLVVNEINANYTYVSDDSYSFVITKATATAVLSNDTSVYGKEIDLAYTFDGIVEADKANTSVKGNLALESPVMNGEYVAAGKYTVGLGNLEFTNTSMVDNYNLVIASNTEYTVTQAQLNVSFDNPEVTYGQNLNIDGLTLTYSGFAQGENAGNVTITTANVGFDTAYTTTTNVGTPTAITPTGTFTADNYVITPVAANLTINRATYEGITHENLEGTYDPNKKLKDYSLESGYTWADENITPTVPNNEVGYKATYCMDTTNYEPFELSIKIILAQGTYSGIDHGVIDGGVYDANKTLADYTLNEHFRWADPDGKLSVDNTTGYEAIYNAEPANYHNLTVFVKINLTKATTSITEGNTLTAKFAGANRAATGKTTVPVNFTFGNALSDNWSVRLVAPENSGITFSNDGVITAATTSIDITTTTAGTFVFEVLLTDTNYVFKTGSFIVVKLTSVAIFAENSTNNYDPTGLSDGDYYTIEDALHQSTSGQVLVVTSNTEFTADPKLTSDNSGYYGGNSYRTVKAGVKVLLPYGKTEDTDKEGNVTATYYHYGYETEVNHDGPSNITRNAAYVNLYLAGSTTLDVEGSILVNALRSDGSLSQANGITYLNNYSYFTLGAGAKVNVLSGGEMTSIGYIINKDNSDSTTTKATINVANGGAVRDTLVFPNFKGGSVTLTVSGAVFPVNQFYINNIEVDTKINYGGKMYANAYISSATLGPMASDVELIGNTSANFIQINERKDRADNYILKTYNPVDGKIGLHNFGDVSFNDISVKIADIDLSTSGKEIPIPYNFAIYGESGSKTTINSRVKLLPGSICEIKEGAEAIMTSNSRLISYGEEDIKKLGAEGFKDGAITPGYPEPELGKTYYYRTAVDFGTGLNKTASSIEVNGKLTLHEGARIAAEIKTNNINNISIPFGTLLAANTKIVDEVPWTYYESITTKRFQAIYRFDEVKTRIYVNGKLTGYPFDIPESAELMYADVILTPDNDFYTTLNAYYKFIDTDGTEKRVVIDESNSVIYNIDNPDTPVNLVNGKLTQVGTYNVVVNYNDTTMTISNITVEIITLTLNTENGGSYATGVDLSTYKLNEGSISINNGTAVTMTLIGAYDINNPNKNWYNAETYMIDPNFTGTEEGLILEFQFEVDGKVRTIKTPQSVVKLGILKNQSSNSTTVYNNRFAFTENLNLEMKYEDPTGKADKKFKEKQQRYLKFKIEDSKLALDYNKNTFAYAVVNSVTDANGADMSQYYDAKAYTVKNVNAEMDLYFHLTMTDPNGLIQYADLTVPVTVLSEPAVGKLSTTVADQSVIRVGSSLVDKVELSDVPNFNSDIFKFSLQIKNDTPVLAFSKTDLNITYTPNIAVEYKATLDESYREAKASEFNPNSTEFFEAGWYKVTVTLDNQTVQFEVRCVSDNTLEGTSSDGTHEYTDDTKSILDLGWDLGAQYGQYTFDGIQNTNLKLAVVNGNLVLTDGTNNYAVEKLDSKVSTDSVNFDIVNTVKLDTDFSLITTGANVDDIIMLRFSVTIDGKTYEFSYNIVNKAVLEANLTPVNQSYSYVPSYGYNDAQLILSDAGGNFPSVIHTTTKTVYTFKLVDTILMLTDGINDYSVTVISISNPKITLEGATIKGWTAWQTNDVAIKFSSNINNTVYEFEMNFSIT